MGESFVSTNTGATCSRANRWPRHCKTPDEITPAGLECEIDESITSSPPSEYFHSFSLLRAPQQRSPFVSIDSSFLNVARWARSLSNNIVNFLSPLIIICQIILSRLSPLPLRIQFHLTTKEQRKRILSELCTNPVKNSRKRRKTEPVSGFHGNWSGLVLFFFSISEWGIPPILDRNLSKTTKAERC